MAQCQNNVKQLALGCLAHESMTKRFPTGGWGYGWTGDPDRGNDWRQSGGWIYNVLPYIEQQPLHDLGIGTPLGSQAKLDAGTRRVSTPFSQLNCPTRRRSITYPWPVTWYNWPTNLNAPSAGRSYVVRHRLRHVRRRVLDLRLLAAPGASAGRPDRCPRCLNMAAICTLTTRNMPLKCMT